VFEFLLALLISGCAFLVSAPIAESVGPANGCWPLYVIGGVLIAIPLIPLLTLTVGTLLELADDVLPKMLTRKGEVDARSKEPLPGNSAREADISAQLVRLIDFLYGLVIVQGAIVYRSIFTARDNDASVSVILALAVIFYTVIRSFIDWHTVMEDKPFQIKTSAKRRLLGKERQIRTIDMWRLYLDFVIVAVYSLLLLRAHVLLEEPNATLKVFFWTFAGIYLLYLLWGELQFVTNRKQMPDDTRDFSPSLLIVTLVLSILITAGYTLTVDEHWWSGRGPNILFLAVEFALMWWYRWRNWRQHDTILSARE
jgi:hypothetical protein